MFLAVAVFQRFVVGCWILLNCLVVPEWKEGESLRWGWIARVGWMRCQVGVESEVVSLRWDWIAIPESTHSLAGQGQWVMEGLRLQALYLVWRWIRVGQVERLPQRY